MVTVMVVEDIEVVEVQKESLVERLGWSVESSFGDSRGGCGGVANSLASRLFAILFSLFCEHFGNYFLKHSWEHFVIFFEKFSNVFVDIQKVFLREL